jgi:hypothetical protein
MTGSSTSAPSSATVSRVGTPEQRCADAANAREFQRIQKFAAACRRQWPGAKIVLRPDGASSGARAPIQPETAHQEKILMTSSNDDFDTPSEADVDACYGSKFLSATEVGDRKIRTMIARVRKEVLQQQGGTTRPKFIVAFTTVDKEMVLNGTNVNVLVGVLGKPPSGWKGAEVGVYTEPTTFGGKPTLGLRLRVLKAPTATPAPKPISPRPAPKPAAHCALPGRGSGFGSGQ